MSLLIYVEGQEEQLFVNRVLRNFLRDQFGVNVPSPILAATSFRIGGDEEAGQPDFALEPMITVGGVTNYASIRDDILDHYRDGRIRPGDVLTTLVDLYALPHNFPGQEEAFAQGLTGGRKASYIEQAWKADIGRSNFFPYIQVHEFEALILTRPTALADFYPEHAAGIEQLRKDCAQFHTPEDINETKETSPSHRILHHLPAYRKIDGFRHLQDIGIPELKAHCPRFRGWMEACERSFL